MSLLLTPSPCAKESHALLVLAAVVNWTSRSYIRIAALSITSAIRLHTVKHVLLQYTHTRGAGEGPARAPVLVPAQQESDAASAPGAHPAALLFVIIVLAAGGGSFWDPRASEMPGPAGTHQFVKTCLFMESWDVLVSTTSSRATGTLRGAVDRARDQSMSCRYRYLDASRYSFEKSYRSPSLPTCCISEGTHTRRC